MDDTTTPCAERPADLSRDLILEPQYSRAQVMAEVARSLAARGFLAYTPGGRTIPEGFDGFGFVRYIAAIAASWTPGAGFDEDLPPLADLRDYMGWPAHEPSGDAICAVIESWGMRRMPGRHPLDTLPGDIIMTLGNGPDCAIVTDAATQDRGELVAMVWAPKGPEVRPNSAFGRVPCRAYRWPADAAAEA